MAANSSWRRCSACIHSYRSSTPMVAIKAIGTSTDVSAAIPYKSQPMAILPIEQSRASVTYA
jgi:hypothetical protein